MVHSLSPADLQMPAHTNADNLGLFGRWRTGANLVLAEGVAAANPLWLSAHIWKISVGSGFLASCPLYASTTLHRGYAMPKSYSGDLRERVIEAVEIEGASRREAAERFGVSVSSGVRWLQRWNESGSAAPKPPRRKRIPIGSA